MTRSVPEIPSQQLFAPVLLTVETLSLNLPENSKATW